MGCSEPPLPPPLPSLFARGGTLPPSIYADARFTARRHRFRRFSDAGDEKFELSSRITRAMTDTLPSSPQAADAARGAWRPSGFQPPKVKRVSNPMYVSAYGGVGRPFSEGDNCDEYAQISGEEDENARWLDATGTRKPSGYLATVRIGAKPPRRVKSAGFNTLSPIQQGAASAYEEPFAVDGGAVLGGGAHRPSAASGSSFGEELLDEEINTRSIPSIPSLEGGGKEIALPSAGGASAGGGPLSPSETDLSPFDLLRA